MTIISMVPLDKRSQTPFGFGGGLDIQVILFMFAMSVCLKRLSALGVGWIMTG